MQHDTVRRRSLMERIFHTVCFEGTTTAILAPTTTWLMQRSVLEIGGSTILLTTAAVIWNIIYNALFDHLRSSYLVKCTARVQAFHVLGLESGSIVIGVNIVAYVLNVSLVQALTLEIDFFLPFLPYTMFYNWAYDMLHERVMKRHQRHAAA